MGECGGEGGAGGTSSLLSNCSINHGFAGPNKRSGRKTGKDVALGERRVRGHQLLHINLRTLLGFPQADTGVHRSFCSGLNNNNNNTLLPLSMCEVVVCN